MGLTLHEHDWNALREAAAVCCGEHALLLLRGGESRSGGDLLTLAR
ncbi:MAG: hypothetical protein KGI54_16525 [Pseudomonadota bacterium]|nr:hypothetical protein [Pseudomonadota bacterium]MDE3208733.1 hypothetical protein [Pseudomonadota bacterium]